MPLKHALKSDALGGCLRDGTGQDFLDPTDKTQIQNMYLMQSGSRTDPEPERWTGKNRFFRWTRTEREPFNFEILEPEPKSHL